MAKESYYFPHDHNARNDKKISALVREYKATGYGVFWATCEMMHEEGGSLEFDDLTIEAIAKDLNENKDIVYDILDKCVHKFKLFTKQNEAGAKQNEAKILLRSGRVNRNLETKEGRRKIKAESGRIGGIKSGESRRSAQIDEAKRSIASSNEANKEKKVNKKRESIREEDEEKIEANSPGNPPINNNILNSNLFRQPIIPSEQEVWEVFSRSGGTKEMSKSFYQKHNGTGWFDRGSPITNFTPLAQRFIENWKRNENKMNGQSTIDKTTPIKIR